VVYQQSRFLSVDGAIGRRFGWQHHRPRGGWTESVAIPRLSGGAQPEAERVIGNALHVLLDFVFGVVQLWLGVSNLAQGDYQALAPANTATGVEATLQEASKIGKMWMRDIIESLEDNLTKLVQIAMYTLDAEEVYEYMEGDVRNFGVVSPDDLADLDVKVTVVLSPQRSQRDLERNELILKIVERYLTYPAFMRPFVRPAMEDMLGTLGVEDASNYLPEEAPDMPVEAPPAGEGDGSTEAAVAGMGNSNTAGRNQNTR